MRTTRTNDTDLVVAAQAGDRKALDELVSLHLPLVYTIVRRALGARPDADDVVQEVMLRALRQLGELRAPDSFRPWLAAITVRQISTHLHREYVAADRTAPLDEVVGEPAAEADLEDVTLLHVDLSRQRRQVVRASQWLDPDDRTLLSLWWLEVVGRLSRPELASALGVTVAHAGVRVQRMRTQLELSRSVVAALDAQPGCAALEAVLTGWDGDPGPLWRKRIARHTRSCAECTKATAGMVATERLLVGFALLPVPLTLTAALVGKGVLSAASAGSASAAALAGPTDATAGAGATGAAGKAGLWGQLIQAVAAHPVVAVVAAGTLVVGGAIATTTLSPPEPSAPGVVAAPTSTPPGTAAPRPTAAGGLAPGPASLESVNAAGRFVATAEFLGVLLPVGPGTAGPARTRATFEVVPGRADPNCYSFRTRDGWYLRHSSWRIRLSLDQGTSLFRGDATFCARAGSAGGTVSLESSNYPGWFLRHRGAELWVDRSDGSPAFRADSSFRVRPPLAR